jgi:hypothetical protein
MRGHHEVARTLAAALHGVDFGRPAAIICEHPERRPYTDSNRYLGTDLEISVFLRKVALGGQDARDVFVVEQHRFQGGGRTAGNDREHAILDLERVEPERCGPPAAIAWIDVNLLLAIGGGFPSEVGAVAAPVARFRPGCAARIVRHPPSCRQRRFVEVVVEGSMQRQRHQRRGIRGVDAAALFAEGIRGERQRQLHWR